MKKGFIKQLNKSGIFLAKVLHIQVNMAPSFGANLTFIRAFPLILGGHCGRLYPMLIGIPQDKLLWQE